MPAEIVDCAILVISDKGNLGFAKNGDEKLTWFSNGSFVFDDVIVYKGQEGAVVELDFSLFVRWLRGRHQRYRSGELKVVDFKVCKLELLNGELGRWVEVKSLGDGAFFLAMDCCFSVSAQELAGCKGNCIYFSDENNVNLALREVSRPESFMFYLEDHSIQKLGTSPGGSQIFWPPPIELGSTYSCSLD